MKIKSHISYCLYVAVMIFGGLFFIGMGIADYLKYEDLFYLFFAGIFGGGLIIHAITNWISFGRTITLDEEGCTVSFWKYKRVYKWHEFKVKCFIKERRGLGLRLASERCVVFSTHRIYKPRNMRIAEYSCFFHPFRVIYIYFEPEVRGARDLDPIYEVDEKLFREKLDEWGIELEDKYK